MLLLNNNNNYYYLSPAGCERAILEKSCKHLFNDMVLRFKTSFRVLLIRSKF